MPTPYAKLLLSTGGAPTSGGLTLNVGDVVQLSAESTVGWTQQRYEIWSGMGLFPLTCPAGWSTDATTGAFYYSTTSTPPPFTIPAGWGKLLLRLRVNNGANGTTLCDDSTAIQVVPTTGILDIAWGETNQFSVSEKWIHAWRSDIRLFETAIGGGIVPTSLLFTATSPLQVNGGAAADLTGPQTWSILPASGVTAGSMSSAHYTLVNNATTSPTASTIAKWGASVDLGAAYFYGAGTVATGGVLRVANNVVGAAARGSGAFNLTAWKWTGSDVLELGDSNNGAGVDLIAKGGGAQKIRLNIVGASNYALVATTTGLGLFGSPSGATAGDGVVTLNAATADPTGAPSGTNVDVWVSATRGMQARTGKALTVTLTPVTTTTATDQRLDKMHRTVHTSDASVTQIATYALPAACCWVARFFVTGQQTGTDATAVYSFEVTAVRAAGAATVTTGTVTTLIDTIGVAGVPSAVAATNDVSLRVQGKAGPTEIDWCISAVHVHLFSV